MNEKQRRVAWALLIGLIVVMMGAQITADTITEQDDDGLTRAEVNDRLSAEAEELNAGLPMMFDEHTRLLSVMALDRRMVYRYGLPNFDRYDVDVDVFREEMKAYLVNRYCTAPGSEFYRDNNVDFNHLYEKEDGTSIFEIAIHNPEC